MKVKSFSRVQLLATLWTVAYQAAASGDSPGKSTGVGCHCLPNLFSVSVSPPPFCYIHQFSMFPRIHMGHHTCLPVCLVSSNIMPSKPMHVAALVLLAKLQLFFYGSVIFLCVHVCVWGCKCGYACVCVYYIFFIHSSVDEHLDCLHILAIVLLRTLGCMYLCPVFLYLNGKPKFR